MATDGTLYQRLGGYDGISAFANDLLPRLQGDSRLGRFWAHRGMRIDAQDWKALLGHAGATFAALRVPETEQRDVVAFVLSLEKEIVA